MTHELETRIANLSTKEKDFLLDLFVRREEDAKKSGLGHAVIYTIKDYENISCGDCKNCNLGEHHLCNHETVQFAREQLLSFTKQGAEHAMRKFSHRFQMPRIGDAWCGLIYGMDEKNTKESETMRFFEILQKLGMGKENDQKRS